MRGLIKTGLIAGFASGVICLIIGIVAKLIGEGFETINPVGYTRLAATILLVPSLLASTISYSAKNSFGSSPGMNPFFQNARAENRLKG